MKKILKASLLITSITVFFSCTTQIPVAKFSPDNNKTYQVDYLFENEGCKVYRFMDNGHYVYFTNCNSDVTSIESDSIRIHVVSKTKLKGLR